MNLIRLFRYLKKKDALFAAVSLLFMICQVWLELKIPDYMSGIIESGNHTELMKQGGFYAKLYNSQFEIAA